MSNPGIDSDSTVQEETNATSAASRSQSSPPGQASDGPPAKRARLDESPPVARTWEQIDVDRLKAMLYELGCDCFFLKRGLGGKYTIPEIRAQLQELLQGETLSETQALVASQLAFREPRLSRKEKKIYYLQKGTIEYETIESAVILSNLAKAPPGPVLIPTIHPVDKPPQESLAAWLKVLSETEDPTTSKQVSEAISAALRSFAAEERKRSQQRQKETGYRESRGTPEVNYASIYEYLACAFSDEPLPRLEPIDVALVRKMFDRLKRQPTKLDQMDTLPMLYRCVNKTMDPSAVPQTAFQAPASDASAGGTIPPTNPTVNSSPVPGPTPDFPAFYINNHPPPPPPPPSSQNRAGVGRKSTSKTPQETNFRPVPGAPMLISSNSETGYTHYMPREPQLPTLEPTTRLVVNETGEGGNQMERKAALNPLGIPTKMLDMV